jgi:hypothetical protein
MKRIVLIVLIEKTKRKTCATLNGVALTKKDNPSWVTSASSCCWVVEV